MILREAFSAGRVALTPRLRCGSSVGDEPARQRHLGPRTIHAVAAASTRPCFGYRSGQTELTYTPFGVTAPLGEFLKGGLHNGFCACLACHQTKIDGGSSVDVTPLGMEDDAGDTPETAGKLSPGEFVQGELETAGDNDWFGIDLGTVWDRFGVTLKSIWDHFDITLG